MDPVVRMPVVAGQFYPSSEQELKSLIASFISKDTIRQDVIGCILPHAGYVYSGRVAVETVSSLNIKDTVVLLGPNHSGYGQDFSIMTKGLWQTPLGQVKINAALAKQMLLSCSYLKDDALAQTYEHSLEVELPILQYFKEVFEIIPITVYAADLATLTQIGREIARSIIDAGLKESVLLVASTDMSHYEPQERVAKKDGLAIEAILSLSEDALFKNIAEYGISMCGYAAVAVMLSAAKILGASSARLVRYQTSGDISRDRSSVVGYAGIIVS